MPALWTQSFPPAPTFIEKDVPNQQGKVFIVTGGASGLGFHLASILYSAGGTVYVLGRSHEKGVKAIEQIKSEHPTSSGRAEFIYVDMSDLSTIKPAAEAFQSRETKLDVLFNNAGIGPESGSVKSAQGTVVHFATNCVGPLLLTELLQPQLHAGDGSARVVWTGSMTIDMYTPKGGIDFATLEKDGLTSGTLYAQSKCGNWFLASEMAKREAAKARSNGTSSKVIHLVINPGNLKTSIWRYVDWFTVFMMNWLMLYPSIMGAYTALWAGVSPDITPEDTGRYIMPWGRWYPEPRADIAASLKSVDEGGTGLAQRFVEWCERKHEGYT